PAPLLRPARGGAPPGEPELAGGGDGAGDRAQGRALARAGRADQPHPLALLDHGSDPAERRMAVEGDRERLERDRVHGSTSRLVWRTTAKKGAPKKAVTTPIGSSAGDKAVRASTSASTRKAAPQRTESGRSRR